MMLKQILTFDINRILRWDLSHALRSDVRRWRLPPILLPMLAGWLAAGILLALAVPFATRRGLQLAEWVPLLVILGSVAAFTLLWRWRR